MQLHQQHPAPLPACSSINNTFNIQGVKDHTMFFKTVEDAARLRLRISECFERAALPQTTPEVGGTFPLGAVCVGQSKGNGPCLPGWLATEALPLRPGTP